MTNFPSMSRSEYAAAWDAEMAKREFVVGQKVTNSAGQNLKVVQVDGDKIVVRFPSGIRLQVAASSLVGA